MTESVSKIDREPKDHEPYAYALRRVGFENSVPLLQKETERFFLTGLETSLRDALQILNPPSSPNIDTQTHVLTRETDEAKEIRRITEHNMWVAGISDFVQNVRVIPPESLFGLCAVDVQRLALTDIGKAIVILKDEWPDLNLFLYHGRARESAGTKPRRLTRYVLPAKSYRIPLLQNMIRQRDRLLHMSPQKDVGFRFPESDFDFLACSGTGGPTLDDIARLLQAEVFKRNKGGWADVRQSSRRTGFKRVEFGISGSFWWDRDLDRIHKVGRTSLGHLFYPAYKGVYEPHNLLLPFLMESARVDIPVLLVPHYDRQEDKLILWGLAVDFWGGIQDLARHRLESQKWLNSTYSLALYPFREISFPQESPQQLLFDLGYAFRTWPWGAKYPVMRSLNMPVPFLTDEQLEDPITVRKYLPKQTQEFLTDHVVRYLHNLASNNRDLLGSREQRLEAGLSFLEDIVQALDGDSIATFLRLLPAGMSITKNSGKVFGVDFGVDIYGIGVLDRVGLLPKIGELLANSETLDMIKKLILSEVYKVEFPSEGHTDKKGRKLFFDFLFQLAENDPFKVFQMLQPVWCTDREWKKIVNNNLVRLVELDERFGRIKRVALPQRILQALNTESRPMTTTELAGFLGKAPSQIFSILQRMEERGTVIRFGGHRGERGTGRKGLGVGGFRAYFCLASQAEQFANQIKFLSAQEKIIVIMREQSRPLMFKDLAGLTGMNSQTVSEAMKILEREGRVQSEKKLWSLVS